MKRRNLIYEISPRAFLARLAGTVLLVNVFVFLISGLSAYQSRGTYQEQARISTQNISNAIEQVLINKFDKIDLALRWAVDEVYERQTATGIDKHEAIEHLEQIHAQMPFIDVFRLVDNRGNMLFDAESGSKVNVIDRDYFIRLRDDPKAQLVISNPVVGRVTGKWTIFMARRINSPDGSFGGIVAAGIYLDTFYELFSKIKLGRYGAISLRGNDLGLIAHYPVLPGGASDVGKKDLSDSLKRILASGLDDVNYQAVALTDHIERTYYYNKLSKYPFHLIVGLATEEYLSNWRRDQAKNLIIAAVFLFCTLYAACLIYRDWKYGKQNLALLADSNQALIDQQAKLELAAQVFEQSRQPMLVTDPNGIIIRVNKYFTDATGFSPEEAIGKTPRILKSDKQDATFYTSLWRDLLENGEWSGEIWNRKKNGEGFACLLHISSVRDSSGKVLYYIGTNEDITEQKLATDKIYHLGHYDCLTGLPNRQLFNDRFTHAILKAERNGSQLAFMLLDLDDFKKVNDTLGHQAGDLLLQIVSERLVGCLRKIDTVARLGGDEFVILLEDLTEPPTVKRIAQMIIAAVMEPVILGDSRAHVGASIGVCIYPDDGSDASILFQNADAAMYHVKATGKNNCQYFSELTAQDPTQPA